MGDYFLPVGRGGQPPQFPSSFHQNLRVRLASCPYANQHPDTSPLPAVPPTSQPLPQTKKELESLASSPPSFRKPVCRDRGPFGWWRWGEQEMGGMQQEREPRAEPTSAEASFPTPTPAPGSLPETGNACYQGLLGGVEKGGPSLFSPCSPLISRLQDFILQTREGGCAVHPFRSLQAEVQSINASSWPSRPTLLPPSLSSPLPSHPSTHSTSHCHYRGSHGQSLTPSPATAS